MSSKTSTGMPTGDLMNVPRVSQGSYQNINNKTSWPTSASQTAITIGPSTTAGTGVITTDNTGQYMYWNGNPLQFAKTPETINKISDMLKDTNVKEIILCKTREECKEKYGAYGLKYFDTMLAEVLQTAIKSEELFNTQLQKERNEYDRFRQAVLDKFGETKEFKDIMISLLKNLDL